MDMEARKLAALKEDLRRDLEAIERVERMMAFKNGSLPRPDEREIPLPSLQVVDQATVTDDDDVEVQSGSLRSVIEQLVNSDPTTRWTTQKVLAHLRSVNYPLRAKEPIYSVGQTLGLLVKKGKIRLVRKGGGSTPHIYKAKISSEGANMGTGE